MPPACSTLNPNVRLTLAYSFVLSTASSLLSQTPLASFILLLTQDARGVPSDGGKQDNLAVGIATGIQGIVNLLCAVPAGVLADRFGRQVMLRAASCMLVVSCVFLTVCLTVVQHFFSDAVLFYCLLGSSALFGVFMGLHSAPLEALFGDSVASGSRSRLYVWRSSLRTAGNAVGPLVSIGVFLGLGDTWSMGELRVVLLAGVGLAVLPALTLWLFRDAHALGAASEGLLSADAARATADGEATAAQRAAAAAPPRRVCGVLSAASIAPVVALSDLLSMLGSGMTIKFFGLFFWVDLHLPPAAVSALYVAGPLGIATCGLLAQRLSLRIGRLQTTLLCKASGIALLVAIGRVDLHAAGGTRRVAAVVIPLYLVRTWLMNCTAGLTKSVLNDYVPKRHRAKWNSLESLNVFSWSGSAALGGLLIDRLGYQATFLITAALQGVSMLCLVPLLLLVQAETGARGGDSTDSRAVRPEVASATTAPMNERLLGGEGSTASTAGRRA